VEIEKINFFYGENFESKKNLNDDDAG